MPPGAMELAVESEKALRSRLPLAKGAGATEPSGYREPPPLAEPQASRFSILPLWADMIAFCVFTRKTVPPSWDRPKSSTVL